MIFKHGLEIGLDDSHSNSRMTLCGWKTDKYLLLEAPAGHNIRDNVSLVGRFFHDGCYYGFAVETLGSLPETHIFVLKYPDEILKSCERQSSRLEVATPATVFRGARQKDLPHNSLVTDISSGGAHLSCFILFNAGDTVGIVGALAPEHPERELKAVVRSVKSTGVKFEYGCEFVFHNEMEAMELRAIMDKLGALTDGKVDDEPPPAPGQLSAPVGTKVQFQIGMTKVVSTLRGTTRKFLFIDAPTDKGKPLIVARGSPAHVKLAAGGVGYSFETELVKQYTRPVSLWALSHPGAAQSVPLRRNARLRTLVPSAIDTPSGKQECAIINLSAGGALLMADNSISPPETHVTINFALPDGALVRNLLCQVRNERRENGKIYAGVSFADGDPATVALIKAYCESCSKYLP